MTRADGPLDEEILEPPAAILERTVGVTRQAHNEVVMPAGFERTLSTDNTFIMLGVELKPIPNVVVKVDHVWVRNDADSGINQFNINLGYAF